MQTAQRIRFHGTLPRPISLAGPALERNSSPCWMRDPVVACARTCTPSPSQNNGRRRLRFCNAPVQVTPHSRSLTRWTRDPLPHPSFTGTGRLLGPGRDPHVSKSETATRQSEQVTNGNEPAARRRRPVPAIESSPAADALAARARASFTNLLPGRRLAGLHPDYKWSSARARPAAFRPPLPAAARCHPHASSPVS